MCCGIIPFELWCEAKWVRFWGNWFELRMREWSVVLVRSFPFLRGKRKGRGVVTRETTSFLWLFIQFSPSLCCLSNNSRQLLFTLICVRCTLFLLSTPHFSFLYWNYPLYHFFFKRHSLEYLFLFQKCLSRIIYTFLE